METDSKSVPFNRWLAVRWRGAIEPQGFSYIVVQEFLLALESSKA